MEIRPLPVQRATTGYVFTTAVTPRYVILFIKPGDAGRAHVVYYLSYDDARALKAVLDILPDPPE